MSNPYYNHGSWPATGGSGASASARSELDAITTGFALLPTLAGNANKAVVVGSGSNLLTVTTGTLALAGNFATTGAYNLSLTLGANVTLTAPVLNGTLATLAGTEAFTNKTYNGNTFTAGTGVLTIAAGKTFTANETLTLTAGGAGQTYTLPATSATIARTDAANTFTGTQTVGALVATTINGNTFTTGTGVLTLAAGKTHTVNNSIALTGTDGTTMTFPSTSATVARTDAANTFTGTQTVGALVMTSINGNTWATGTGTLSIAAGKTLTGSNSLTLAGTDATVMTFPSTSATVARTDAANTFTGTQTVSTLTVTTLVDASGAAAGQIKFPATQNASANANTLDDYAESQWTATLTGVNAVVTGTVNATKVGNVVTLDFPSLAGTSNTTAKTITGMPVPLRPATATKTFPVLVSDNGGSNVWGVASLASSGTLTLYPTAALASWTGSGTATANSFSITYTTA